MKKSAFILSILMVCATLGMSQGYTFKVLASKGVTQVDNGSGWTVLKTGAKLGKDSKVKVSNGSYVGLMHSSGKTMELKSAGTYSVENLSGKLNNSKSSFTSKYASFVMNKMDASEGGQSYNTTGSVSRGASDVFKPGEKVKVLAPKHIKIFKNVPAQLAWESVSVEGGYVVSVVDLFNETYWSAETNNKSIEIDLSNVKVVEGTNYLIRVSSKADATIMEEKPVILIEASKEKIIMNELAEIASEIDQESPLDQLTMASFFEEKGLTIYALSSLSKAHELAPEVEDFETLRTQYYFTKADEK